MPLNYQQHQISDGFYPSGITQQHGTFGWIDDNPYSSDHIMNVSPTWVNEDYQPKYENIVLKRMIMQMIGKQNEKDTQHQNFRILLEQKDATIRELNEENFRLKNENITLLEKVENVTQQLNTTQSEKENQKHENDRLRNQVSEQDKIIQDWTRKHAQMQHEKQEIQRENIEQISIIKQMQQDHQEDQTELNETEKRHQRDSKIKTELTEELKKLKNEIWRLKLKESKAPFIYAGVFLGGMATGGGISWLLWNRNNRQALPLNPAKTANPLGSIIPASFIPNVIPLKQPATNEVTYPKANPIHDTRVPHQPYQPITTLPMLPPRKTTDSPLLSPPTFREFITSLPTGYLKPVEGFSVQPRKKINLLPTTAENHPNDYLYSYLLQQIKKISGHAFEEYLDAFFKYQYYRVFRPENPKDKGADLIIETGWERWVIQAKQQKDNIGSNAINAAYAAKDYYEATRAIVICITKFTPDAIEKEKKLGVELWDGQRLLKELHTHYFFYIPVEHQDSFTA